jgi:formylglycine-generating enzyme
MVRIAVGSFRMGGTDRDAVPSDAEGPVREVQLDSYFIAPAAVTNAQFASFVKATGYVTDAERLGWSYVFAAMLSPRSDAHVLGRSSVAPWWIAVRGAAWRAPEGPGSAIGTRSAHPVVHVSWHDALAYCAWRGRRLPTEAEWERAARGGLEQRRFPWGDEERPHGRHRMNIWHGSFPHRYTGPNRRIETVAVTAYPANGLGLFNAVGNVWEWCSDWWSTDWHVRGCTATRVNPRGPLTGIARVIRGGSYLCHESYCNRYRVAARTSNTPDSTTGHMGFRCAADVDQ